jgi:hypothetical protein
MSFAANDPPHELSAAPQSKDNLLDRRAVFGQGENCGIDFLPPEIALVLQALRGGKPGLIVVAPIAERIWRIDLRTASRNALLAFSIRCQRSATWVPVRGRGAASPAGAVRDRRQSFRSCDCGAAPNHQCR